MVAAPAASGILALQVLVVVAHCFASSAGDRVSVHGVAEQLHNGSLDVADSEDSFYCDNKCPEGMGMVQELDASEFPELAPKELKLVRCVAPGVQEDRFPPFFILNAEVMVGKKKATFYGVGRLDMMSVVSWAYEKTFADYLSPDREKTVEEMALEEQIRIDYESLQASEIHQHHGSHAHSEAEIIAHWLVEETALKATKYGLKYVAYHIIGHATAGAAMGSAAVSAVAGLVGILSTFSIMFFPVTFAIQWCWSVQAKSDAIAEAGQMGSYLFYKYHYVNLFNFDGKDWKKMNPEFRSLCGDDIAKEMMSSMMETSKAVKDVVYPLTSLGGCTIPAATQGPGGNKVSAKTACIKQVWDILSMGPMYPTAKMSVLYGEVADQFYPSLYGQILKNIWHVDPDEVPNILESIRASPDPQRACKFAVTMDKFYELLFKKLYSLIMTWNKSFLREYGTGMICSRKCKSLINSWDSGKATCDYQSPRVVTSAVTSNGDRSVFKDIPTGRIAWGSFTDAFKKVILNRKPSNASKTGS